MTDDERREEESSEETASSPDQTAERPADDASSRVDPETRWGDPERRGGDPETDLPNVPRVRIPGQDEDESLQSEFEDDAPEFTADVNPEQTRLFWGAVVLANVGIASVALGAMLIYFRSQTLIGVGAVLLGIGALSRVYAIHREYTTTDWSADDDSAEEHGDDSADDASDRTDSAERNR